MSELDDLWARADALDDEGAGDLAADLRSVLHQYDASRCAAGHDATSCGCKQNRILWNMRGVDIDEIVIHEPSLVHVEQMHDRCWWIGIYLDDERRWSGNFSCDSKGRMRFTEQDDDVDWDADESHDDPVAAAGTTEGSEG